MRHIAVYLFLFFHQTTHGQTLDSLVSNLNKQTEAYPTELIYVQTNKDTYETGEDLWFKAYQLDARRLTLSGLSQTLYLQVISGVNDSIVWQEKYPIENGIADGHVYLDKNLKEGNYFLEAYTSNSFRNDSSSLFAVRSIKIQKNISDNISQTQKQTAASDDFRFNTYPEGGNLVAGIPSRLAFKATDGRGNPMDISGALYEDEIVISELTSKHDGMGVVSFTPLTDKSYHIQLSDGRSYSLPTIYSQGFGLQLTVQDKDFVEFKISRSKGLAEQTVYLLGQLRGVPYCGATFKLLEDSIKVKIPLKEFFGQGVAEFTLFDENMHPLAERLVYVHPEKKLHITAKLNKAIYMVKNEAKLSIKVTDENGNPVKAHLGVSVFDKAYADQSYPVNIQTHCLLSSQIHGNIHNPYYYFDKKNNDRHVALDMLLMTQGWRCYVWQYDDIAIEKKTNNSVLADAIRGIQTTKKKQMRGSEQLIQISGAEGNSSFVWADSLGNFSVEPNTLKELGGGYFYLKPMLTKENEPKIELEDSFIKINEIRKQKNVYYPFIDTSRIRQEIIDREPLINQFGVVLLSEVVVMGKAGRVVRDKFMGRMDSLAQINLGAWVCKHGWLENYKIGYTHHHDLRYCPSANDDGEPRTVPVIGKTYSIMKAEYYQCNGRLCFRPIDRQKVVYRGAIYSEEELLRMNNLWRTKGYYAKREFYLPDSDEMLSSLPDMRNALFWTPSVITDAKGEATVTFWCSDLNTKFVGRMEGTNGNGLLGIGECEFNVIRNIDGGNVGQ